MHTRIICIDSEPDRVARPVEVMRAWGFEVMVASSPGAGLALVQLFPPDVILLQADLANRLKARIGQLCPSARLLTIGQLPPSAEELKAALGAAAA